jgi:hypothetical protein
VKAAGNKNMKGQAGNKKNVKFPQNTRISSPTSSKQYKDGPAKNIQNNFQMVDESGEQSAVQESVVGIIQEGQAQNDQEVCAKCHFHYVQDMLDHDMEWIGCEYEGCGQWYHIYCMNVTFA